MTTRLEIICDRCGAVFYEGGYRLRVENREFDQRLVLDLCDSCTSAVEQFAQAGALVGEAK